MKRFFFSGDANSETVGAVSCDLESACQIQLCEKTVCGAILTASVVTRRLLLKLPSGRSRWAGCNVFV